MPQPRSEPRRFGPGEFFAGHSSLARAQMVLGLRICS